MKIDTKFQLFDYFHLINYLIFIIIFELKNIKKKPNKFESLEKTLSIPFFFHFFIIFIISNFSFFTLYLLRKSINIKILNLKF